LHDPETYAGEKSLKRRDGVSWKFAAGCFFFGVLLMILILVPVMLMTYREKTEPMNFEIPPEPIIEDPIIEVF
jgi:hypothetical protein